MRETHKDGYRPDDWWEVCIRCGRDFRKSEMVTEPVTEKRVCYMCCDGDPNTKPISAKW